MWSVAVFTALAFAGVSLPARSAAAQVAPADSASPRTVAIGGSVTGSIRKGDALSADSPFVQNWTLAGQVGQTITVDVMSTEFDAYVMIQGPGIRGSRDYSDDDSGGMCNARLTVTFPETGTYDIIVSTAGKLETGAFTLAVASGSKPKSLTRCNRDR